MASVFGSGDAVFKEFCPLYSILNAIPSKIQKGFRSVVVYLTAIDANGDYIAIGSSIGMLYLHCRQGNQMKKYNLEGKSESITVTKLLSCFDDLVAVGTASGRVAVFQLVSPLAGRNKQLRRFDVVGIHRSSITALAWSPNGMKLFSGDEKGKIVYSALDLDQGSCNSSIVLEEPSAVVQLEYNQKVLLISTLQRSLLFYTEEKSVQQVGTQPRKINGKFGACFVPGLCRQSDLTLYASRPGLRVWKSDVRGCVQATFILKDLIVGEVKPFELYPRAEPPQTGRCSLAERHFGLLSPFYQEGWVLTWDEYSIYLFDTLNQAVIGGLEGFGDIVSVSCTDNEIFLLKGDRDILRISNRPEGLASKAHDGPSKLHSPMTLKPSVRLASPLESGSKPGLRAAVLHAVTTDDDEGVEKDVPSSTKDDLEREIFSEKIQLQSLSFDEKAGDSGSSDLRRRGCSAASETSSLNSVDSGSSSTAGGDHEAPEVLMTDAPPSQRFSIISTEEFDQELIVKSIKVKRRKKKRPAEHGGHKHEYSSLETTPSCEHRLPCGSPNFSNSDLFSCTTSLMSSSLDQLSTDSPDQDSVYSAESHGFMPQANGSGVFSVLKSPESVTQLEDESGGLKTDTTSPPLRVGPTPKDNLSSMRLKSTSTHDSCLDTLVASGEYEKTELRPEIIFEKNGAVLNFHEKKDHILLCNQGDFSGAMKDLGTSSLVLEKNLINKPSAKSSGKEQRSCLISTVLVNISEHSMPGHVVEVQHLGSSPLSQSHMQLTAKSKGFDTAADGAANAFNRKLEEAGHASSSDEEDIYGRRVPHSSSEASVAELSATISSQDISRMSQEEMFLRSDQLSESWMGYSGPGYAILSLVVSEKHIWCLDYRGSLYCSALPGAGLRWQKFEELVQQVAVSPSGTLLWKIEQKSNKAFACGKVTIKGKRHWYEALPQTAFVALSDDTAWIIRTNGDLYIQTGLSVDRPCARAVKVDCPCPLSQITSRDHVVWALTEQQGLVYREGVSSFCAEGEQWKSDIVSERQGLQPVCITLGDQNTVWTLDNDGNLWFRTGVTSKKPQGDDDHWWQVSITDYVVFDQYSLFQTIIQATHTVATVAQAPVEKVADKLRMTFWSQQPQSPPSLLGINSSGVWITSGKNEFHVAKGSLIGTYWNHVVPRGTASATKWAFVFASAAPTKEGSLLWLSQSNKDLFCVSDQNPQFRPSTVQLPQEAEMLHFAACQDAVWGLDAFGRVFIRTLSKSCPTGMHWTRLDLSQLGAVKLVSLTCGNQHIWACDTSGLIYFRVGTQPLNHSMMLPAWIIIDPPLQPLGLKLVSVHSSSNDRMLWATDNRFNVHIRRGISEEMPVGTDWEHVPGLQACQLAISTRTVWARCPNGDVARRYGITDKNPAGDYWKKIPGSMASLAVTPMDDLWAVGSSGYLLQRLTKTFSHSQSAQKNCSLPLLAYADDFEDEWEVI
ncbi:tectonin beta-propeller repeat-containing protein 2 isoform X2 [Ambystoma mexicanum]|uniref:tectonin beta-propeller repeat-containing protein 2 isoform X2 n=1 Tax=Ambystoma mexicanum TaxID=8296 RepID=UPI0037E8DBB1